MRAFDVIEELDQLQEDEPVGFGSGRDIAAVCAMAVLFLIEREVAGEIPADVLKDLSETVGRVLDTLDD